MIAASDPQCIRGIALRIMDFIRVGYELTYVKMRRLRVFLTLIGAKVQSSGNPIN
jgi:hypothetical protein